MKLLPFGHGDHHANGEIDIPYLTGWLESLIRTEEDRGDISASDPTPRGRRLNAAYDALAKLTEVCEMGGES